MSPTLLMQRRAHKPRKLVYWRRRRWNERRGRWLHSRLHFWSSCVRACEKSRLREAFLQQAAVAVTSTPEEMTRHLESEIGIWREVITRAKITVQ